MKAADVLGDVGDVAGQDVEPFERVVCSLFEAVEPFGWCGFPHDVSFSGVVQVFGEDVTSRYATV